MRSLFVAATLALAPFALAQQVGTNQQETHPTMSYSECTSGGSCSSKSGSIVVDANWRWLHETGSTTNCYTGNEWDSELCPDNTQCAANCALEGADYQGTYGISTSGNSLTLTFVTTHQYGTNIGSRVYFMESDSKYRIFKLLNKEFTFDIDVSNLGCGLNGALYFVEMDADGGMGKDSTNKAGAKYGTGYCDAQCPRDMKFIAGKANVEGWKPSDNDENAGKGNAGTCCNEMDIWEANNMGAAYTPHVCSKNGLYRCEGEVECGDTAAGHRYEGICDKDGCDFSHFRMGDHDYYGKGKIIDTTKPFTVVTQFLTEGNSDNGALKEIRRIYVQGGKTYANSWTQFPDLKGGPYDSITEDFCTNGKILFGDKNHFGQLGGVRKMGESLGRGMVLVMSVWDDHEANMLWLDSNYPLDKSADTPGVARGECPTSSGVPADVESNQASSTVKFSNIKVGPIGSTFSGTPIASKKPSGSSTGTSTGTSTGNTSSGNCKARLQQCGGSTYTGATCCVSGSTCVVVNSWYSQCQ